LNALIHHCEFVGKKVQIIVSACARTSCDTILQLQELFGKHAFAKYVAGKTPNNGTLCQGKELRDRCDGNHCRGGEIFTWLRSHPEVDNYVAIDDCTPHFQENDIAHVNVGSVLTMQHLPTLQKILKLPPIAPILHPQYLQETSRPEEELEDLPLSGSPLVILLAESLRTKASPLLDELKRCCKKRRVFSIVPLITHKMAWSNNHTVKTHTPYHPPYPWIQHPIWAPEEITIEEWIRHHPEIDDVSIIANEAPRALQSRCISEKTLDEDKFIKHSSFAQPVSATALKILGVPNKS
jgi:hypothetical protein